MSRWGVIGTAVVVAALVVVPPLIGGFVVRALTTYLIFGLLALSVGLITGYGRLFNLGAGANFGISAYTVAILSQNGVTNPFVLFLCALASGLLVALLFAFYALIASGVEYLMLTFLTDTRVRGHATGRAGVHRRRQRPGGARRSERVVWPQSLARA